MIITIICAILLLYGLIQYDKGHYAKSLLILVFFASSAFIINLGTPVLKYKDFGLLLLGGFCFIGYKKNSNFFKINSLPGAKISLAFLIFFLFEFLYTYLNEIDTIGNILAVIRDYLYALTYFAFRKAPVEELKKGVILIFKAVILACAFFVLQYFTHIQFTGSYISENNLQSGNYRMQSTPPFISIFLLALLFYFKNIRYRWILIILLFGVLMISQNRTPLIALFIQIGLFVLLSKNVKYKIQIIITAVLIFPFINSVLSSRLEQEGNVKITDVPIIEYISSGDYIGLARQNTFMFRIALIAERFDYLISHPEKTLFGVGAMHENTAQKEFAFHIGTARIESNGDISENQLDSIDVVWGPLLIRYGLIGISLHLAIISWMIVLFYKRRKEALMMLGFLTYVAALAQSFSSGGMFLLIGIMTMMGFLIVFDKHIKLNQGQ